MVLDKGMLPDEKSFLLETYKVVAGLTSDANVLIDQARVSSQRYTYTYQEPMPVP